MKNLETRVQVKEEKASLALFGNNGAITNSPSIRFAEDPINGHPEAKVVLVERDVNSWYL